MYQPSLGVIDDGEILYRYASPSAFPADQEEIPLSIFQDGKLSCDWEKHQPTPEKSLRVIEGKTRLVSINVCNEIRHPRNPKNGGKIEVEWHQEIIHDPMPSIDSPNEPENYSHSLIKGKKKAAIVDAIRRNSTWRDL
ncbi:MAG: hypothetical protein MUF71_13900 [Candidatus Kapabacteria bacterium]|jgi:hypothetical protein|nr:hypothetical protein [Candidatus Kapabacteria bacterium]